MERPYGQFRVGERRFGDPTADEGGDFEDERRVRLGDLVGPLDPLVYVYDFGDGWKHTLLVEQVTEPKDTQAYPLCTAGARACPPEDCGGVSGYQQFLAALLTPEHDEHGSSMRWVGGVFDPEGFDLNRTNRALRALRGRR